MFRYLLFSGDVFYPGGGWEDFIDSHDSLEAAVNAGGAILKTPPASPAAAARHEPGRFQWAHVVDVETGHVHRVEIGA